MSDTAVLQLLCAYCGKPMYFDRADVSYHGSPDAPDHVEDASHPAVVDLEGEIW